MGNIPKKMRLLLSAEDNASIKIRKIANSLDDLGKALNKSEKESQQRNLMMEKAAAKAEGLIYNNIENEEKGKKKIEAATEREISIRKKLNRIKKRYGTDDRGALKLLGTQSRSFDKYGNVVDAAGKSVRNYAAGLGSGVGILSRFNMEQLGVMFGGMALNRAMANLNATSREWLGMGELTSTMMGVTMLSANMDLLEYGVLPLFDALTNLPEGAQKAIGYTTLALEGLGSTMMVGGQLMLGLDSASTMLAKIAGISPDIVFTSKGLSALKTKLKPLMTNLKKVAKLAVIGITLNEVKNDIKEGEITAAIGTALAGYGVMKGNKWAIGVGLALKFAGDEGAQRSVARFMISLTDMFLEFFEWLGDSWDKVWRRDWADIGSPKFISDFGQIYKEEAEKMNQAGKLSSDAMKKGFV